MSKLKWRNLRINETRLRSDIETLGAIGTDDQGRLTRHAFSAEYEQASEWLAQRLSAAGISNRRDSVGNIIGRIGPTTGPAVISGSHIDTVRDGGRLDGAYGVLAALEVMRTLAENDVELMNAVECIAFVDEEGWYFDCLGSKALTGAMKPIDLQDVTSPKGDSLTVAMTRCGLDPSRVAEAARDPDSIAAYIELHIEQGPVLETMGIGIGNVEAIVGVSNRWLTFEGEANHSGTTPMDLRRDAFLAAAVYCARVRELVLGQGTTGRARVTFGLVDVTTLGANVVPPHARLHQEIRDVSALNLGAVSNGCLDLMEAVSEEFNVRITAQDVPASEPALMSERVRSLINKTAASLGLSVLDMPSGAVHDAQHMAAIAPTGMIFVPSQSGYSHRPDEHTEWADLFAGANVLLQAVLRLSQAT